MQQFQATNFAVKFGGKIMPKVEFYFYDLSSPLPYILTIAAGSM
jgi:hypothetical protein